MKLKKYLFFLLVVDAAMLCINLLLQSTFHSVWWKRIAEVSFYLSPSLLAWCVEGCSLKSFFQNYQLRFKDINWKVVVCYVCFITILFPILVMSFVYIAHNMLGINALGQLTMPGEHFSYAGISFDGESTVDNGLLFLLNMLYALGYGITLGMLSHVMEEVGWRGFLWKHLPFRPPFKPLLVGLVWTLWGLPLMLST